MLGNLYRRAKVAVAKVEKDAYEIVAGFHINHVLQEAGSVVMLSVEEAKYHLLAGRVKPVAKAAPVDVVPAPAAPAPEPEKAAEAASDGEHDGAGV